MTFKRALEDYLSELASEQRFTVPETSHYSLLRKLLNEVGQDLNPQAKAYVHPKDTGAGVPDLGLYAENQEEGQKPAHGVIEAKPTSIDLDATAESAQVAKYLGHYGQVLVTNFYQFVLVTADGKEERYQICDSDDEFWQQVVLPRNLATQHADALKEYLLRVLRRSVPLSDPKDVAWILASYAREAKARIETGGVDLSALDTVKTQLEKALGLKFEADRGDDFFRSTLVQTLFYGVFSAWVLWHESKKADGQFVLWRHIRELNVPAIQELFEQLTVPSRLRPLNIEEVLNWTANALNRVSDSFFDTFGQQEAIQYFYEPFLEAFDPDLRTQLGVWYTPPQIVKYMVARVDAALREELGIENGLLNEQVYVLDPACGTGAYLVEVLRHIYETASANEGALLAAQRVRKAVAGDGTSKGRIFGFELLPAPFVVAHLQISMMLQGMKAPIALDNRAGVYLTNALTGWEDEAQLTLTLKELQKERDAARDVKQQQPILVILGNPPYYGSADAPPLKIGEERELVNAYKETKNPLLPKPSGRGLNDTYIRFFRMAERKIVENEPQHGIICYISNYSWLHGLSHPGMREKYLEVFDSIYIDSLNGDKYDTGKVIPAGYPNAGEPDPSIFSTSSNREGIQLGTAVSLLIRKKQGSHGTNTVHFRNLWGRNKLSQLEQETQNPDTIHYQTVTPEIKLGYPFLPRVTGANYFKWVKLINLFPTYYPGIQTAKDSMLVDIDKDKLIRRIQAYLDPNISHDQMKQIDEKVMTATSDYEPKYIREFLQQRSYTGLILSHTYRPLDVRWIYWEHETKLLDRNRSEYRPHVHRENVWLVSQQKTIGERTGPPVIRSIGSLDIIKRGTSNIPLYLYDEEQADETPRTQEMFAEKSDGKRRPNLSKKAQQYLKTLGADVETLFYHALAIMHAPHYREENAGALRQDWPRIPLVKHVEALQSSAQLGRQVAALLDVERPVDGVTEGTIRADLRSVAVLSTDADAPDFALTGWGYLSRGATMPKSGTVIEHDDGRCDIYLNETTYWAGVPERVWNYTLGGYQVLKKWLSYRDKDVLGRDLKAEETRDFMQIARRIEAILLLENDLDANYASVCEHVQVWDAE